MNNLIKFINERNNRERRLILALVVLLFLLIVGGFTNGIISSTTMASKRYQIAKNNYVYVKKSALMIINSSRSEMSKKDLTSIEVELIESSKTNNIDYKYSSLDEQSLTIVFSADDLLQAGQFLKESSQITNSNLGIILLENQDNQRIFKATFKSENWFIVLDHQYCIWIKNSRSHQPSECHNHHHHLSLAIHDQPHQVNTTLHRQYLDN